MFKKTILTIFTLLVCFPLFSQGIVFSTGSWSEIMAKAKSEKKFIFVDAYAEWCGPCKWMAKNVFTDSKVGTHFNKNYISYKFDMEKGEGPVFAKLNSVQAYPTLLFFNYDGELIHKAVGALPSDQLISQSENALDPAKQIYTLKKKFEAGERKPEFLYAYAKALQNANEDPSQVAALYLNSVKKEDWTTTENFELIYSSQYEMNSEVFQYVSSNLVTFKNKLGTEMVNEYVNNVMYYAIDEVEKSKDQAAYKSLKAEMQKILGNDSKAMIALMDWRYNLGTKNEFKYLKLYMDKYCNNPNQLNSVAWELFESGADNAKLKAALKWTDKALAKSKIWYILDTKANILNKLGKKSEALTVAKEAVKIARENGEDATETEMLIKELEN
jgi:thiol-disulfide isomerase/thioredoxin